MRDNTNLSNAQTNPSGATLDSSRTGGKVKCQSERRGTPRMQLDARTVMNPVVIKHVPVTELPAQWRAQLTPTGNGLVTVRIEAEADASQQTDTSDTPTDDPLFGMWRDREDMKDVEGYIRSIRASRFNADGTPRND
jgi:hypothetical protein